MLRNSLIAKPALLLVSLLIGATSANAHTTPLTTDTLNNCDALTKFARNLDHNDARMSDVQIHDYVDARAKCMVQHQDEHLQSEKYFVKPYGKDRDPDAQFILDQYVPH